MRKDLSLIPTQVRRSCEGVLFPEDSGVLPNRAVSLELRLFRHRCLRGLHWVHNGVLLPEIWALLNNRSLAQRRPSDNALSKHNPLWHKTCEHRIQPQIQKVCVSGLWLQWSHSSGNRREDFDQIQRQPRKLQCLNAILLSHKIGRIHWPLS